MDKLILNAIYTREEVNKIFAPEIEYTGHGTWGQHGFINIKSSPNDFIFYVNLTGSNFDYEFDEYITEDGVLTWQSQRRHKLDHRYMQSLINHNHEVDNIYLFVKKKDKSKNEYMYMGKLAYLTHDNQKEKPVHFKFSLLSWNEKLKEKFEEIGHKTLNIPSLDSQYSKGDLNLKPTPKMDLKRRGVSTKEFKARHYDFANINEDRKKIGFKGECLVLESERNRLIKEGRRDLSELIEHTSLEKGDGAGYDIKSFNVDGSIRYIEVKTTTLPIYSPIYITNNEIEFSKEYCKNYYLYRVYNYCKETDSADYYIEKGNVTEFLNLEPINYKATFK